MKYQQLKKRVVIESLILGGGAVLLLAGTYMLDSFSTDYKKDSESLQSKVNEIAASTSALHDKFDKIKQHEDLYKKILELQAENKLSINQQDAKNSFNLFRDQYYLNNLHLSASPVTEVKEANSQRTSHEVVFSEVNIDFEGLSDEYVYDLLDDMEHNLPGGSKIVKMTLTRQASITDEALRSISENGSFSLVKAEIKSIWYGINSKESDNNAPKPK